MPRPLKESTLDLYVKDASIWWMQDQGKFDKAFLAKEFFNFSFKDEWEYLVNGFKSVLGGPHLSDFSDMVADLMRKEPRSDSMLRDLLAEKLAIDEDGKHIAGKIGTTIVSGRVVRRWIGNDGHPKKRTWNIYAGEGIERSMNSGIYDAIPDGAEPLAVGALNTRISNGVAQLMANAGVDDLDSGSAGATIQGRTGAQPADPDTAVSGTNLFTLTCSTTAFGAASDAAPGALKTAASITDDSSADATDTLGYCRASSSNAADTPLDDKIDGEAGTSGADFNFNTLAIVTAATVSMTSWTVTMPES